MKTTKAIPYLLAAGALIMGTACSSTNTDTTGGASAGASASGGSSTSGSADATHMGTDMNPTPAPDANSGMATSGAMTSSGAAGVTSSNGAGDAGGAGAAADMTAFTGTFATMKDPVFLINAASSNLLEIQAGKMASQQATKSEVKQYAQMMVSHHTQTTQELKNVATPLGVTLPQTMIPVHQAMADRLANKTGKDFDEAYMDLMETAHKMDIAMFEVKSKAAETPTVKGFATRTLPMLRSHETMAGKIEKKVD
jgi:putative membrane protein